MLSMFGERFDFRILRGHTVENLLKMRTASKYSYMGFAALGATAILFGEELMRFNIVYDYPEVSDP